MFDHLGGSRFAYRISISEVSEQHFELKLPLDTVNIEQGAETKLKIGIDRSFGFKGEVELSAEELPDGSYCRTGQDYDESAGCSTRHQS